MPYITLMQSPIYHQISFEEILSGEVDVNKFVVRNITNTRTHFTENVNQKFLQRFDFADMISALEAFNNQHENLFNVERANLYETFYIPKRTGGLRRIDEPLPDLMNALRQLKLILEEKMFALYHTSAFAYVRGRSTIDAAKRHQLNKSRWFLKTDFSNFFGNSTFEFVLSMLSMVFPFSEIMKIPRGKAALERAISLCFLNGGLPQGTPISPMLTNLIMIPFDHCVTNGLRNLNGNSFVYTRYADDSTFSCRHDFKKEEVIAYVESVLKKLDAPFKIKDEKTHYGSNAGRNWILGVMLNKDNEITIGHKNKQRLRAMISSYILDRKNGKSWELHDVQVMSGKISYYKMVEKEYVQEVIKFNNEKYGVNLMSMIREDLS